MDADALLDLVVRSSHAGLRQALRDGRLPACAADPALQELVLLHGTPDVIDAFFEANRFRAFAGLPRAVLMRRDKMAYLLGNGMTAERPIEPWGAPFVFRAAA